MNKQHVTYEEAFDIVASVRPGIEPNDGFVSQLKEYQQELLGTTSASDEGK